MSHVASFLVIVGTALLNVLGGFLGFKWLYDKRILLGSAVIAGAFVCNVLGVLLAWRLFL